MAMVDLFDYQENWDEQKSLHNQPELSVTEISGMIRGTLEGAFSHVRVRGEISGFKRAPSGHLYFSLKDDGSVLRAVCWRGSSSSLQVEPQDGLEVIVTGKITGYGGSSNYQIVVSQMRLAGVGALMALLEERRKKLTALGVFDEGRKRPLPFLPRVIGVVTSPTGAVIRDILHRISDRFPSRVLLWPVLVQGEQAAKQVAAAIRGFSDMRESRPDVLIVARGGGSIEDLWAFNEEEVVMAAAECEIPLISAVGHETDTTLIDYAADKRAPTPTAAAEMAVPVLADLRVSLRDMHSRVERAPMRMIEDKSVLLRARASALSRPTAMIEHRMQQLDHWHERLHSSLPNMCRMWEQKLATYTASLRLPDIIRAGQDITRAGERLDDNISRMMRDHESELRNHGKLLESYSYRKTLERGFAVVRDANDALISSSDDVSQGDSLKITFKDGDVKALSV